MSGGARITEQHRANIGRRVRWDTVLQGHEPDVAGTITGLVLFHGWPRYVIEWDDGAPGWWARETPVQNVRVLRR